MRPRRILAIGAAALLAVAGIVGASAAGISALTAAGLFSGTADAAFAPGARSAVLDYQNGANQLTVTVQGSSLAELQGQPLRLALITASGSTVLERTVSVGSGGNTVIGSSAVITLQRGSESWPARTAVTNWALMLGGVLLVERGESAAGPSITVATGALPPVVVEPEGPITPPAPDVDYEVTVPQWVLTSNNPIQVCATVTVTGQVTPAVPWRVRVDTAAAPFYGQSSGFQLHNVGSANEVWRYEIVSGGTGVLYVQAQAAHASTWGVIATGQTRQFRLCNNSLPTPPNDPERYSVTTGPVVAGSQGSFSRCQTMTVTGTDANWPWYFGWRLDFDLAPLKAAFDAAGRGVDAITWGDNAWRVTIAQVPGDQWRYVVTSNSPATITGAQSYQQPVCLIDW